MEKLRGRMLLPGYVRIELIYVGRRNLVYRAWRAEGAGSEIVKTPVAVPLGPFDSVRLQYEYAVLSALDVAGVVKPIALKHVERRPFLVLEDAGGRTLLRRLGASPPGLRTAIDWSIELAATLAAVHAQGFVHRDFSPENVVVDGATDRLTLVDFDAVAPLLDADTAGMPGEQFLGTAPYASPELRRRITHPVDYRTDYYSLGATLHEIATGAPPENGVSRDRSPLGGIIARLLARYPGERYQGADALLADLRRVREEAG